MLESMKLQRSVALHRTYESTMTKITERLQLKDKKFKAIQTASRELLAKVWSCLNRIDPDFNLSYTDKICVKVLTPNLKKFLTHCCRQCHYFFEVRKCGNAECGICGRAHEAVYGRILYD